MNNTSEPILSKRLKCLSCSTRREILLLIKRNAMLIRDIATSISMTQNTVKRHIKILNDCELLSLNKGGIPLYILLTLKIYATRLTHYHVSLAKQIN